MRPEEEVPRIYTRRIIAIMKNEKPIWDGPKMNFPRYALRLEYLSIGSARAYVTVASAMARANPWPAFIRAALVHFGPKPVCNRN